MRKFWLVLAVLTLTGLGVTATLAAPTSAANPGMQAQQEISPADQKTIAKDAGEDWVLIGGQGLIVFGACLGAGVAVFGGARGIGSIGASAMEAIARQPEAYGQIFTAMLISAALIEGFTFFALVITLIRS